jgi:hypothetical protein
MKSHLYIVIWFLLLSTTSLSAQVMNQLSLLPDELTESSGLEFASDYSFWSHNDSGSMSQLVRIDTSGQILQILEIAVSQVDWEDLTKDPDGNLYIGDFGNNSNDRVSQQVYKISSDELWSTLPVNVDTIEFTFGDQSAYPPLEMERHYDLESMVYLNDTLHLFTKDRSIPYQSITKRYKLPSVAGSHVIYPVDTFFTSQSNYLQSITSAGLSDNGNRLALLNASNIWLFTDFQGSGFFSGTVQQLQLGTFTQKEAICFYNDMLYLTDERSLLSQGALYRVNPDLFLDINEKADQIDLKTIYSEDGHFVEISWGHDVQVVHWEIYDIDGHLMMSENCNFCEPIIQSDKLSDYPRGQYVLHLTHQKGTRSALLFSLL